MAGESTLLETESPHHLEFAFLYVHAGDSVGVDFFAAESGAWLGVEFYDVREGEENVVAKIADDRLAFEQREGKDIASVRIDCEEAYARAQLTRRSADTEQDDV